MCFMFAFWNFVDLMRVDLVAIDLERIDLVTPSLSSLISTSVIDLEAIVSAALSIIFCTFIFAPPQSFSLLYMDTLQYS